MENLYKHYSEYDGSWNWEHFTPREVSCRHCGEMVLDAESMDALEELRTLWGQAIVLNSAHRCATHNKAVGGSPNSRHLKIAFDCRCPGDQQQAFINAARKAGFTGAGRYPGKGFVHVDMGPKREWIG